jgi:hypothetical protein
MTWAIRDKKYEITRRSIFIYDFENGRDIDIKRILQIVSKNNFDGASKREECSLMMHEKKN